METYRLVMGKDDILKALSDYLTLQKDKPIVVKEKHRINYVGYYEEKELEVTIYYEETVEILGHPATKTVEMDKEDVKEILDDVLNEKGYYIQNINYQTEIRSGYCYPGESDNPSFNGIELTIGEIQKGLQKKRSD